MMPSERTDADLLSLAVSCYHEGKTTYREKLLECGWFLHEFILARLKLLDGVPEHIRLAQNGTRRQAVKDACAALLLTQNQVNSLIATAVTVRLLSPDGNIGQLAHCSLRAFRRFVRRKRGVRKNVIAGRDTPISSVEEWESIPEWESVAKELFAAAVHNSWTQEEVRVRIARIMKKPRVARLPQKAMEQLRRCSPGDLATVVIDLVRNSLDPRTAASALVRQLSSFIGV